MQDNILPLIGRTAPLFEKDIVIQAAENAEKGFLVTFGIVLSCPVNGCG